MEVILEMISMEGVKWVNTVTPVIYAWVIWLIVSLVIS